MKISQKQFDRAIVQAISEYCYCNSESVKVMLTIPGIWEIVSEYFNNAALEIIKEKKQKQH